MKHLEAEEAPVLIMVPKLYNINLWIYIETEQSLGEVERYFYCAARQKGNTEANALKTVWPTGVGLVGRFVLKNNVWPTHGQFLDWLALKVKFQASSVFQFQSV